MTTQTFLLKDESLKVQQTCADQDEDCPDLEDKVGCWLYDPGRGMCPYLRSKCERTQE